MKPYIEQLKNYLAEHPPRYPDTDIHTLLEYLYRYYVNDNPVSSDELEALFQTLEPVFEALPLDESDLLFRTVCDICTAHERAAFLEGIQVGARLLSELEC